MKNHIRHIATLFLLTFLSGSIQYAKALDTTQDPIKIYTAQDLADFAALVNGGQTTLNAILMADIDYKEYKDYTYTIGYLPTCAYKGTFDGNYHTINIDLVSDRQTKFEDKGFGLFGSVTGDVVIKNLAVTGSLYYFGYGFDGMGSIVGSSIDTGTTTITNCTSSVSMKATRQQSISHEFMTIGGLVGKCHNTLSMNACSFSGKIESIYDAYRTERGIVVGGLVGSIKNGTISDSYVATSIINKSEYSNGASSQLYPIYGITYQSGWTTPDVTVTNSYYSVSPMTHNGEYTGFVTFEYQGEPSSDLTEIEIDSDAKMIAFAKYVAAGNKKLNGKLTKCIVYSGTPVYHADGYQGTFDGQGHTITLNMVGDDEGVTLFRKVDNGKIHNLITTGSVSTGNNNNRISGIVGLAYNATITNCISSVVVTGADANDTQSPDLQCGGIAGYSKNSTFENCASIGSIKWNLEDTYPDATPQNANGFIGNAEGENRIINSFSRVDIGDYSGDAFHPSCNETGCYYVNTLSDENGRSTALPESDFRNGKLCAMLNKQLGYDLWYQKIGTDETPVFKPCGCNSEKSEANSTIYKNEIKYCPGHNGEIAPDDIYEIRYSNTPLTGDALYIYPSHKDAAHTCCAHTITIQNGTATITDELEFIQFAELVRSGQNTLNAILTRDLDLTTCSRYSSDVIGNDKYPYKGTFDGGYHTINIAVTAKDMNYGGLFGYVDGAVIKNVIVTGSINANDYCRIGGIVGYNINNPVSMEKCMSLVDISRSINAKGTYAYLGGLVGASDVAWSVNNCAFAGSINISAPSGYKAYQCNGMVGYTAVQGTAMNSFVYPTALTASAIDRSNTLSSSVAQTNTYYRAGLTIGTLQGTEKSDAEFSSHDGVKMALNGTPSDYVWYLHNFHPGNAYPTIVGYEWIGNTSSDWNIAANWKNGEKATEGLVIVNSGSAHYPNISTETVSLNEVRIMKGAEMSVNGNADITVISLIDNRGTLTIDGKATVRAGELNNAGTVTISYGDAYMTNGASPSLIVTNGTVNNVTVNRTITPNILFYTGSATVEGDIQSGFTSPTDYISYHDAASHRFVNTRHTPKFAKGLGVGHTMGIYSHDPTTTFTQIGTVANSQPRNVSFVEGWNWLSNPYPFTARIEGGLLPESDELLQSVWIRINNGNAKYAYMTYNVSEGILVNGDGSDDLSIAPFQCYSVFANEAATLEVNGIPETSNPANLKSASIDTRNILRLYVSTNGNEAKDDEAVIVMREGGEEGESDTDSYKQLSNKMSQISLRKLSGSTAYAIGVYPEADDILGRPIPLVINPIANAKDITISACTDRVADDYCVSLYDDVTKETVDLRTGNHIVSVEQGLNNRLFVVLTAQGGVATSLKDVENRAGVTAFGSEQSVIVLGDELTGSRIEIMDLTGRRVYTGEATGNRAEISMHNAGIYIVKIAQKAFRVKVK